MIQTSHQWMLKTLVIFVEGRYLHNLKVSINILIINYEEKTGIFTGEKLGEPLLIKDS